MIHLSDVSRGRDNNLNLIRMLAAIGVMVSHSFPLTLGPGADEPLRSILGFSLGSLSVYVFFGISGFLITRSYLESPNLKTWFAARILRLYPALVVAFLLTVLLLGPALTTLPLDDYFADAATPNYALQNLTLFDLQHGLPGVFADNPYPRVVNGSIWTLGFEVACYLGILAFGLARLLTRRSAVSLILAGLVVANWQISGDRQGPPSFLESLAEHGLPFIVGTLLFLWRDRVPIDFGLAAALACASLVLYRTGIFHQVVVFTLVYFSFCLAYLPAGPIRLYNRLGDYSYGLYIFAWPVQQSLVSLLGPMTPMQNLSLALPVTLFLAFLSWTFVERPALNLTRKDSQHRDTKAAIASR